MSGIASELGGSKSTLWAYFPSKLCLFSAVLVDSANTLQSQIDITFDPDKHIELIIGEFCKIYTEILCSKESVSLHRIVISEGSRFPQLGILFSDCFIFPIRKTLIAFLAESSSIGLLRISDPAAAADILRSLCHGSTFQSLLFNLTKTPDIKDVINDSQIASRSFLAMFSIYAK